MNFLKPNTKVKLDRFANGFAWWVTKNGQIVAQGYNENLKEAKDDAQSEAWFWSVHEYEKEDER